MTTMAWILLFFVTSRAAVQDPLIMYGGAWKGPHAEQNVMNALALGYRAFDTGDKRPT